MWPYKTTLCYKFKDILTYMGVPDQIALHSVCVTLSLKEEWEEKEEEDWAGAVTAHRK